MTGRRVPRRSRRRAGAERHVPPSEKRIPPGGVPQAATRPIQGIALVVSTAVVVALFVTFFTTNAAESSSSFQRLRALVKGLMPTGLAAMWAGLLRVALPAGIALCIAIPALLLGFRFLRLLKANFLKPAESVVFAFAFGAGGVSLVTLGLGLAGLIRWYAAAMALAVMALSGIGPAWTFLGCLRESRRAVGTEDRTGAWAVLLVAFGAAFALVLALANCAAPALDYDGLEYHLGAPARYVERGRICFLPGNVYSSFPLGMEMLYLDGMALCPDRIVAGQAAKVLNWLFALAVIASVWCFGRRFFSAQAALAGAAFFALCPWVFATTAANVYVTMGWSLYTALAFFCAAAAMHGARKGDRDTHAPRASDGAPGPSAEAANPTGWVILSAISAGLAVCCKYPSAVFVAGPVAAAFVAVGASRRTPGKWLKRAVLFAVVTTAVASPWFVRNIAFTRNPVYPLAWQLFDGTNWDARKNARWVQAHEPDGYGLGELKHAVAKVHATRFSSVLPYLFVAFALFGSERKTTWVLVSLCAAYFALWFLLTHRIERFMVPVFPVLAAASGWGFVQAARTRARALALFFALAAGLFCCYTVSLYSTAEGMTDPEGFLAACRGPIWRARAEVMSMPAGTSVLAVGEAQGYYWGRRLATFTVFDGNPLDGLIDGGSTCREIARRLREAGYTHVLVNWPEVIRLNSTYEFEYDGANPPGYSPWISPEWFDAMVREGALSPEAAFGSVFSAEEFREKVSAFSRDGFFGKLRHPLHHVELLRITDVDSP